jgi:hypothetical protein
MLAGVRFRGKEVQASNVPKYIAGYLEDLSLNAHAIVADRKTRS